MNIEYKQLHMNDNAAQKLQEAVLLDVYQIMLKRDAWSRPPLGPAAPHSLKSVTFKYKKSKALKNLFMSVLPLCF